MEENRKNYRIVNIAMAVLGMVLCIGAFFAPAPAGLLADESTDLFHVLMSDDILTMFAVPGLMVMLSAIIVMISRPRWLAVVSALTGSALYAWMDYNFAMANQSCYGTLINAIGAVLVIAASLLEALATPTVRQLRREEKLEALEEKNERTLEAKMFFDDAAEKSDNNAGSLSDDDSGIDINELRYEALRIKSKEMTTEDSDAAEEVNISAINEAAKNETVKTKTEDWSSDDDLEKLLLREIENDLENREKSEKAFDTRSFSAAVADAAAAVTAESANTNEVRGESDDNTTDFYGGLEDLFLDE